MQKAMHKLEVPLSKR